MSIVAKPDWESEDQTTPGQVPSTTVVPNAPSGPGTQGSVPSTSSLASPTARKGSSGFTNLKQYIQANQGNNIADTVTAGAQNQLNQAQQGLQQGQQEFNTGLATERAKIQGAAGEAGKALNYIQTGTQPLITEAAPTAIAKPEELRQQFTSDNADEYAAKKKVYDQQLADYNANQAALNTYNQNANQAAQDKLAALKSYNYAGPQGLNNINQIQQNQAQAQDFANATKNENGRGAILQTLFGKQGQYSGGARNFDNLLLGSNQSNLDKLRQLRQQSVGLGQNINQVNQQVQSGIGATKGTEDIEKAKSALAMKQLRDTLFSDLQNQATTANTAGNANAATIDPTELAKFLTNMAGYEPIAHPGGFPTTPGPGGLDNNTQMRNQVIPPAGSGNRTVLGSPSPNSQIGLPEVPNTVTGPTPTPGAPLDYVNLMHNLNFAPEDVVDPNRSLSWYHTTPHSDPGQSNVNSLATGNPNQGDILVRADQLAPLFKQTYQNNDWQSINANELNRRNILSQVLADNATNGIANATQKNEVQTTMDPALLEQLKQTPKMAESNYTQNMLSPAPGTTAYSVLGNFGSSGYQDPLKYAQDLGIDWHGGGATNPFGDVRGNSVFNPQTGNVDIWQGPAQGSYKPQDFINQFILGPGSLVGMNNTTSPALMAQQLKDKYTADRLKALGINGFYNGKRSVGGFEG